jgi:NADH-quinone oxidoreductase subunit L
MGRQLSLIWAGQPRSQMASQAQESPRVMTTPLLALALLAAIGGVANLPGSHALGGWLAEVFGEHEADFHLGVAALSTLVAFVGLELAFRTYGRLDAGRRFSDPLAARGGRLLRGSAGAWGVDAIYQRLVVAGFNRLGDWLAGADLSVLGAIEGRLVRWTQALAGAASRTQTGELRWNMVGITGALIVMLAVLLWSRGG